VPQVFVTRRLALDPRALAPAGVTVEVSAVDRPLTADEIATGAADAEGMVSMLYDPIDAGLIARLPRLRVIGNHAAGVDNIDLAATAARGIVVTNTPDVLTDATADLTLALLLALARRLREGERLLRSGSYAGWSPTLLLGRDMASAALLVVGMGRIGRAVTARASAFGMRVEGAGRKDDLDLLLPRADVVSLHCPLTPETRHLIDARRLALMKRNALLLNTARGPLVDEAALVAALDSGRLGGAGLDVFEEEPRVHPGLAGRDDVVLLPHLGSATAGTREAMARLALQGCFDVLAGRTPRHLVRAG
jgi:glyoxylate reductase